MEFVILTGLSGAGKTRAMHAMEDIGFFCVDNLPPALIPVFYDLCVKSEDIMGRVAVVTDTRGGELFKSFFTAMEALKHDKKPYKILFLDASDNVLVRRFKETRRKRPLSDDLNGSLEQAVKLEREMLKPMRESSDYVIDTSLVQGQLQRALLENQDTWNLYGNFVDFTSLEEALSAWQALEMATVNGAEALGRDTGVIAPGKTADLILVDFSAPNLTPCHDVAENLVYAAHGSNVDMNMARGKVIYEKGEFFTLDLERIRYEVERYALPLLFGSKA